MKKQILLLGLLCTASITYGMEKLLEFDGVPTLVTIETSLTRPNSAEQQQKEESERKCVRVARYFVKHAPEMKLNDAFDNFTKLDQCVKDLITSGSISELSPLILLIAIPKDIFSHTMQCIVPRHEQEQTVILSDSQFCRYKNGYPEYGAVLVHPTVPKQITNNQPKMVPTNQALQKIFDLNVVDAFNLLSRYTNQKVFVVKDIVEDPSNMKDSTSNHFGYFDDEDLKKSYAFCLNDFIKINTEQQTLLEKIVAGHTAGLYDIEKRHKMTQEKIQLLIPIRDVISANKLLNYLQINVDLAPPTRYEKTKDKLLLAIPLTVVEGVLPQLIYNAVDGKLQGTAGGAACYAGGFIAGNYGYPCFDWFNSGAQKVRAAFGSANRTPVEKRWSFALLSLMHYASIVVAEKLLSYQAIPYRIIGYSLYGVRGISYVCGLFINHRHNYHFQKEWFKSSLAEIFYLKKYENPLERRNKDDKSYTLGDSLNNPKNSA